MPETCISAFIEYLKFCLVKGFTGITNIKIERYISCKINLCGKTNFYNQYKGRTGKKANIDKITRSKQQQQHDIRLSMRGKKKPVLAIGTSKISPWRLFLTIMKVGAR